MAAAPPPISHNSTKLQTKASPMVQSNPQNNVATMARHVDRQMQRQTRPQHRNQSCSRKRATPTKSDPTLWLEASAEPRKTKIILQNSLGTIAETNNKQNIPMDSIVGTPHQTIISRPRTRLDNNSCCPPACEVPGCSS